MSKKLLAEYRELAKRGGNFRGLSLVQHQAEITRVIRSRSDDVSSLLDYGSGAGDAYREPYSVHHPWHVKRTRIRLYDPSFKGLDVAPPIEAKYDGVLCSDVLEHVPEDEVDELVKQLFAYARLFVWASVCCRPAKKSFADGTNMHVTQHPLEWWHNKFIEHAPPGIDFYLTETP